MARREILAEVFENQAALPVDSAVVELLLSQVEAADLLLINKCDLASDDAVGDVVSTCKAVNAAAEVATTQFGFMDLDVLLPPLNAAAEVVPQPSTGMPPPAVSAETIGFTSFVYRASRPSRRRGSQPSSTRGRSSGRRSTRSSTEGAAAVMILSRSTPLWACCAARALRGLSICPMSV